MIAEGATKNSTSTSTMKRNGKFLMAKKPQSGFFKIHFRPIGPIGLKDLIATSPTHYGYLSNNPDYQFRHDHNLYCS